MPRQHGPTGPTGPTGRRADLPGLAARRDALSQAAAGGADPRTLLDAALAELDAAVDALAALSRQHTAPGARAGAEPDEIRADRNLVRAVFQEAPAPLYLLDPDCTVRRANRAASQLIGSAPGYATGKPLIAFVDLPSRAPVESMLAAVLRTGQPRQVRCHLLGAAGRVTVMLTAAPVTLPGHPPLLIVTAATGDGPAVPPRRTQGDDRDTVGAAVEDMARRMDLITAVTRLLLENSAVSEAATLQRCARLLAGAIARWVIVDVERAGRLHRQCAVGPQGEAAEETARVLRHAEPTPGSAPWQVHATGRSMLLAHADDLDILGTAQGGTPVLMLLGATSVLSVPLSHDGTCYGVLTLARGPDDGMFEVADLGLTEELGQQLAIAVRVHRMFRRRSEVAEALQTSLLPARLPDVPGLDLAAAYVAATGGMGVGGDFYDLFPLDGGWVAVVGDVCGRGEEAAAMTAAARHAIRAVARWEADPAAVLHKVNEVLLTGDYGERFVTVKLAYLRWAGRRLRVDLVGAGHPGPAIVRADGRVDVLDGGGLPLGLFDDVKTQSDTVELTAGDLLFFFTDGVTEARGDQLSYFEDRLSDELAGLAGRSAAETVRGVQDVVTSFSRNELRDDMAVLAVRVTEPPLPA